MKQTYTEHLALIGESLVRIEGKLTPPDPSCVSLPIGYIQYIIAGARDGNKIRVIKAARALTWADLVNKSWITKL